MMTFLINNSEYGKSARSCGYRVVIAYGEKTATTTKQVIK